MKKIILLFVILCLCLIISCVSTTPSDTPGPEPEEETAPPPDRKNYFGHGEAEGLTFLDARNKAIMDAVRKAVIDLIGPEKEQAHRDTLKDVLYNRDPNSLIYKDTIDNVRKEMLSDEKWMYECTVDVNLKAILIILEASGILGEEITEPTEPEPEQETTPTESNDEITDEEKNKWLKRQRGRIMKAMEAETFGILISTKEGQSNIDLALGLKHKIEVSGKNALLFAGEEINPENVLGFEIDAWVNTACPRIADDHFDKPVLNPDELEQVFEI